MTLSARRGERPWGLCADCRWARLVRTRRGSTFLRCAAAAEDPRLPKYPPVPVRRCVGYAPAADPDADQTAAPSD